MAFYSPHIWLLSNSSDSCYVHIHTRTLLSNSPILYCCYKTVAKERKLRLCPEIPHCPEVFSLSLPIWQLYQIKAWVGLDQVVLQHTHNEWSSITNPGLLTIASQQVDVQAEMLPYTMATNPYYFSVVWLYQCLCFVSDCQLMSASPHLPVTLPFKYRTRLSSS